jgi:Zn-dependent protease
MQVFLFVTVGWIFSVCLHEFGHALVAYKGGDHTVRDKGYLTLNPLRYTHPVYSLLLPLVFLLLGGIGLPGGAVFIDESLLRSKQWRTATALAGPAMNVLLVQLLCLPFWFGFVDTNFGPALAFLCQLQISAVIFNLLPLPPLDGFRALSPWLPPDLRARLLAGSNIFLWVLFIVMWNVPVANHAFWGLVNGISTSLGVDPDLAQEGYRQYRFWNH